MAVLPPKRTPVVAKGKRLNKLEKRSTKHDALLSKVRNGGIANKKPLKRRRPGKKLKVQMESMRDALPELSPSQDKMKSLNGIGKRIVDATDGVQTSQQSAPPSGYGSQIKMRSLRHKPGAMKRKRTMELREMGRFKMNLAQIGSANIQTREVPEADRVQAGANGLSQNVDTAVHQRRWAAIRDFIAATAEKHEAFTG